MSITKKVTYSEFKNYISGKSVDIQYVDLNNTYFIYAVDGAIIIETTIDKQTPASSDQLDFETNILPTANANLAQKLKGDTDNTKIGNAADGMKVAIQGGDGARVADVEVIDGFNSLRTFGVQAIESLRGFDPIADVWFFIGTENDSLGAGDAGDTVRVQIAAGDDPSIYPAVDVTSTLTVTEAGDETALANLIVNDLNSDSNFNSRFFARRLDDTATTVYITARQPGPGDERPNNDDFVVSSTGNTVVTRAFDKIIRRSKITSLARDPANPTLGVLGISGSVTAGEGDVTGRIVEFAESPGGSPDLRVDGSVTPQTFRIEASPDRERFITSLRFEALGNGIQFTNFLSKNGILTNGVLVTIRSNNSQITFPAIRATEDFGSVFARGASDFNVFDVSGTDYFRATLSFTAPFQLFKQGTFGTDDFIEVAIRDDLSSGLVRFRFIAFGFEREF